MPAHSWRTGPARHALPRVQGVYRAAACWAGTRAAAERMTLAAFGAAYGRAGDGRASARSPYRELVTLLRREAVDRPRADGPEPGGLTEGGRVLRALPLEERFVVYLADVEERTLPEVADILGTPAHVVRDRLRRGHRRLAATLPPRLPARRTGD